MRWIKNPLSSLESSPRVRPASGERYAKRDSDTMEGSSLCTTCEEERLSDDKINFAKYNPTEHLNSGNVPNEYPYATVDKTPIKHSAEANEIKVIACEEEPYASVDATQNTVKATEIKVIPSNNYPHSSVGKIEKTDDKQNEHTLRVSVVADGIESHDPVKVNVAPPQADATGVHSNGSCNYDNTDLSSEETTEENDDEYYAKVDFEKKHRDSQVQEMYASIDRASIKRSPAEIDFVEPATVIYEGSYRIIPGRMWYCSIESLISDVFCKLFQITSVFSPPCNSLNFQLQLCKTSQTYLSPPRGT